MKSRIILKKAMTLICLVAILVSGFDMKAYAASVTASVSSKTVTQGEEVSVSFTLKADSGMGILAYTVSYDANILEYISGGSSESSVGMVTFYEDMNAKKEHTFTIKFKAKGVGTTTLTPEAITICTEEGDDFAITNTPGSITVKAPVIASANNNLSSLSVTGVKKDGTTEEINLSPGFSKNVTEYSISLSSDYERLALSAVAEDNKATIKTSGTSLDPGANTTTVTVIAENGEKKYYKIYTALEEETTTEAPIEENRVIVYNGKNGAVMDMTEETALPEGFELVKIDFNGSELVAATDMGRKINLILIRDEETKEMDFYVYTGGAAGDESSYLDFVQYNVVQRRYIMLPVLENFIFEGIPAVDNPNLQLTKINVGDGEMLSYKLNNIENIYIVRALNWNGELNHYYYDISEGSMIPVFYEEDNNEKLEDAIKELNEKKAEELREQHKAFEKRIEKRNILIYAMTIAIVVLSVWGVTFFITSRKNKKRVNAAKYLEQDDFEEEIMPAMVAEEFDSKVDDMVSEILSAEENEEDNKEN